MPPPSNLAAFALAAFTLIVIPGPSVLFTVGRALSLGRRGGLLSTLGNALGTVPAILLVSLVSLGLGRLIADSVVVFTVVKLAGAVYLGYLGVQAIRHRHAHSTVEVAEVTPPSAFRQLRQSFLVGVTNPKTAVFFVAVLPQFVSREAGAVPLRLFVLGAVFAAIALLSDSIWALAAGTARAWFGRNPRRLAGMTAGGGIMMIGLGGVLVATGSEH